MTERNATQPDGGAGKEKKQTKLAEYWHKLAKKDQKLLMKIAVVLVWGIILMNMGSLLGLDKRSGSAETTSPPASSSNLPDITTADDLEQQLKNILSEVRGAGQVSVAVRYSESATAVYVMESERSQEESTDGQGQSQSKGETLSIGTVGDAPVRVKEELPKVQGVIVVASGAGDAVVRERLFQAVKSLLGLSANQIAVIEGERSEQQ